MNQIRKFLTVGLMVSALAIGTVGAAAADGLAKPGRIRLECGHPKVYMVDPSMGNELPTTFPTRKPCSSTPGPVFVGPQDDIPVVAD